MYIESKAYVSNLRLKLICGSPVLAPQMTYYEWWSRALQPGTHFIQVCASAEIRHGLLLNHSCRDPGGPWACCKFLALVDMTG